MTRQEYNEYVQSFVEFMEKEGINCLSPDNEDYEGFFSWHGCDICKVVTEVYSTCGYNPNTKDVQSGYQVCSNCLYFYEYGQLDDMTMMEMED